MTSLGALAQASGRGQAVIPTIQLLQKREALRQAQQQAQQKLYQDQVQYQQKLKALAADREAKQQAAMLAYQQKMAQQQAAQQEREAARQTTWATGSVENQEAEISRRVKDFTRNRGQYDDVGQQIYNDLTQRLNAIRRQRSNVSPGQYSGLLGQWIDDYNNSGLEDHRQRPELWESSAASGYTPTGAEITAERRKNNPDAPAMSGDPDWTYVPIVTGSGDERIKTWDYSPATKEILAAKKEGRTVAAREKTANKAARDKVYTDLGITPPEGEDATDDDRRRLRNAQTKDRFKSYTDWDNIRKELWDIKKAARPAGGGTITVPGSGGAAGGGVEIPPPTLPEVNAEWEKRNKEVDAYLAGTGPAPTGAPAVAPPGAQPAPADAPPGAQPAPAVDPKQVDTKPLEGLDDLAARPVGVYYIGGTEPFRPKVGTHIVVKLPGGGYTVTDNPESIPDMVAHDQGDHKWGKLSAPVAWHIANNEPEKALLAKKLELGNRWPKNIEPLTDADGMTLPGDEMMVRMRNVGEDAHIVPVHKALEIIDRAIAKDAEKKAKDAEKKAKGAAAKGKEPAVGGDDDWAPTVTPAVQAARAALHRTRSDALKVVNDLEQLTPRGERQDIDKQLKLIQQYIRDLDLGGTPTGSQVLRMTAGDYAVMPSEDFKRAILEIREMFSPIGKEPAVGGDDAGFGGGVGNLGEPAPAAPEKKEPFRPGSTESLPGQ